MKKDLSVAEILEEANHWYYSNDLDRAFSIAGQVELLPEKLEDLNSWHSVYELLGVICFKRGKLAQAGNYFTQSLEYAIRLNQPKSLYTSYDNLAAVYIDTNKKELAAEYLQKAIALKEVSGNERDLGKGMLQLASLYLQLENFDSGKQMLTGAREYLFRYKQKEFYMHYYFAYAMQFKRENKFMQAVRQYRKAIYFARIYKEYLVMARVLNNIADIYISLQKWKEAELVLLQALNIAKRKKIKVDRLQLQVSLARVAIEKKDYLRCKRLLAKVNLHRDEHGNDMVNRSVEELSARLYEEQGQPKEALKHYKQYIIDYRKFYDNELSRSVLDIQAKYESEKKERELQQAKLQQTESELKALRTQINPHFIFNALGSLRNEMLQGNLDAADQYLLRFSRLLRLILDSARRPHMLLKENLELLHLYIQTEQTRQNNRFTYTIKVAPTIDTSRIEVPGLILQPLVENAILHGLFNKTGGKGKLGLVFSKTKTALKIVIADNGIGRKRAEAKRKKEHTSHATALISETLAQLWKTEDSHKFFITKDRIGKNGKPAGTSVTVLLPLAY